MAFVTPVVELCLEPCNERHVQRCVCVCASVCVCMWMDGRTHGHTHRPDSVSY